MEQNILTYFFAKIIPIKPNICPKFEQNQWFELTYHLLPGFLMDTLLKPEKNSRLNQIQTHDFYNTCAVL